jgi:hypothetical protein
MKTAGIPGLAMVAIKGDRVVLSGGYSAAPEALGLRAQTAVAWLVQLSRKGIPL